MKIVIPGGSGQVGRVLARYFHAKGDEVTVLDLSLEANRAAAEVIGEGQRALEGSRRGGGKRASDALLDEASVTR